MKRWLALVGCLVAFSQPACADGVAHLVKNLRSQPTSWDYVGGRLTEIDLGAIAYLDWLNLGSEPWITDGTLAGTRLMANLAPGSMGSDPLEIGKVGATVFLAVTTPASGRELWRTNGRAWGTAQVLDIRPGSAGSDPLALGVLGGVVLFTADDGVHGRELWRSDGTTPGTWMVADLWPGAEGSFEWECQYSGAAELGGRLLFCGRDPEHGRELWSTDGTIAGTQLLADLAPGADGGWPMHFLRYGSRLYFSGEDPAHGRELWATNGSTAGTARVIDLAPGEADSGAEPIGVAAHGLVFAGSETGGYEDHLWVTDGSVPGTVQLAGVWTSPSGAAIGGRVVLAAEDEAHGWEPWVTDGTPAGTRLLADLLPGTWGSIPYVDGEFGGLVFLCADILGGAVNSLFVTDGTSAGTRRLGEVGCDWIDGFAAVGGATLFNACWSDDCCSHCECDYCQVWRTDGTDAGTWSLYPGVRQTSASSPGPLVARSEGLAFGARPNGPACAYQRGYLFTTDGTADGTELVTGPGSSPVCFEWSEAAPLANGEVLFRGWQETTGSEPWVTDPDGAHLVRDIAPGAADSDPGELARVGPWVYFSADDPISGDEPWISDGTANGTSLLADLGAGATGSLPQGFADVFGRTWFGAASAYELWESGGDAASTIGHDVRPGATAAEQIQPFDEVTGALVFRVRESLYSYVPGAAQASLLRTLAIPDPYDFPPTFAPSDATLFFFDVGATGGCELWTSDGTAPGTALLAAVGYGFVHDWGPWRMLPCPAELVAFGGRVLFPACTPSRGCELWTSDGTAAGTRLFDDFEPGPASFLPASLTVVGDRLYFAGCRQATGCEPWVTDGSVAGTHRVADVALGPPASDPHDFTLSGRVVYFAADNTTGEELWAMPIELFYDGFETGDTTRWSGVGEP